MRASSSADHFDCFFAGDSVEFGGRLRFTGADWMGGGNDDDRDEPGGKDSFWSLGMRSSEISTVAVGLTTYLIEHLCADDRRLSIEVANAVP
jgi:hypothetical protein